MRVTTPFPRSLSDVAEFLNLAAPGLTSGEWDGWRRKRSDWMSGKPLRMTIEKAKELREELHRELTWIHERKGNAFARRMKEYDFVRILNKLGERPLQLHRQAFYFLLGEGLRSGSIASLKVCPGLDCGRYHVANDPRRKYCAEKCRHTFHNRQKAQEGKFREYREARRQQAIRKATRLIKEGLSFRKVQAETRLPRKVIEKLQESIS